MSQSITDSRVEDCAVSIAATIESRKIPAHEVPIVLGILVNCLADLKGLPDQLVLQMVAGASVSLRKAAAAKGGAS